MNASMQIVSPAFAQGQSIPIKYTGEGDDISPPLQWSHSPRATKSFLIICDDPDAPGQPWIHWVIFNIPPTCQELSPFVPTMQILPDGSHQGLNDFRRLGYAGPMPPPNQEHRYFFKLHALDTVIKYSDLATADKIQNLIKGHVLADAKTFGVFQRTAHKNRHKADLHSKIL